MSDLFHAAQADVALECQGVYHGFGAKKVLHDVNFKVERGQFLSLVGPSGCGKSTLLRAIVGTHLTQEGWIRICRDHQHGIMVPVEGPGRDRGIVYQHYSLFPFLTAQENVALGLTLDQTGFMDRILRYLPWRRLRRQHLQLAAEYLERVRLSDAVRLYPHEMSGGMRQRVALAQTLIMKPEIILLDEPFGALDEATREDLQRLLLDLYQQNRHARAQGHPPPYTLVIVTHELNEAIYVGDRLIGLSMYWNWAEQDHDTCPGATIVYDRPSPVFEPHEPREFEIFEQQRNEVRRSVFDESRLQPPEENITYWRERRRTPPPPPPGTEPRAETPPRRRTPVRILVRKLRRYGMGRTPKPRTLLRLRRCAPARPVLGRMPMARHHSLAGTASTPGQSPGGRRERTPVPRHHSRP